MASFGTFNINKKLVSVLKELGYDKTSAIQEQAIPMLLKSVDGVYKAPTGTGKTLAYIVPIINQLSGSGTTEAVIILPTKVLCAQLGEVLKEIREVYPEFTYAIIKESYDKEKNKTTADIVVTTPNIYLDIRNQLNCKYLQYLVFDEGDMLIFGGFEDELKEIMSLETKATKCLFTASVDEHLNTLVKKYMGASQVIDVTEGMVTSTNVKHVFIDIRHLSKGDALVKFINLTKPYKTIAFVSAKKDIQAVEKVLLANHIKHVIVHGDLPKRDQKNAIKEFKEDRVHLLLASDIAARGFDVADVTDVISLDLPKELTYYFHRAGRAGRFNNVGTSYVFYNSADTAKPRELLKKAGPIFTYSTLKDDGLKADRDLNTIVKKKKLNNIYVETEIKKVIAKKRSKKVKPCYKKKVKWAIDAVKSKHKEDVIKTNIRKKKKVQESKDSD